MYLGDKKDKGSEKYPFYFLVVKIPPPRRAAESATDSMLPWWGYTSSHSCTQSNLGEQASVKK